MEHINQLDRELFSGFLICFYFFLLQVQVGTDNTGYVDIFTGGEYINTMLDKQCVQIPEQSTDDFTLRFGFTTTTSDGNIYLDNIGINNQKCPRKYGIIFCIDKLLFFCGTDIFMVK